MKFLVDANLPPGLATWLRTHGHETTHISDHADLSPDDRTLFRFARQHEYILVTKDEVLLRWLPSSMNRSQLSGFD